MKGDDVNIGFKIRKLQSTNKAHRCALLMSNSEPWITLGRTYDDSLKMLLDPLIEVYLAVVEDEIIGFIILQMHGAFKGYIQTVAVDAEWRNKGIGSRLLKFAEGLIFSQTPNVFICVSSFNKKAQELYKRLGYETIGELKDYMVSRTFRDSDEKDHRPAKRLQKDLTIKLNKNITSIIEISS